MSFLRPATILALLLAIGAPALAEDTEAKKPEDVNRADMAKLNGVWTIAKAEAGGQELPKEFFAAIVLTIEEEKYTVDGIPEGKETGVTKIDAAKQLKEMTIEAKEGRQAGKTTKAIYKFDDEKLVVCYNLGEGDFPTEFKSAEGEPYLLIAYERKQDEEKK